MWFLEILATLGLLSGVGWFVARRFNRRREIRTEFVHFSEHVIRIADGDWAGSGSDAEVRRAWTRNNQPVYEYRQKVQRIIAYDRFSAGRGWCDQVEACLTLGCDLVNHIFSMCTLPNIDHEKWNKEYEEKRKAFKAAHAKLTR